MGRQIIKQPNGLLALWSSVVDDFLVLDATPLELFRYERDRLRQTLRQDLLVLLQRIRRAARREDPSSWEEALTMRKAVHGEEPNFNEDPYIGAVKR